MANEISPENEQFIEQQVTNGSFSSREEALDAGIDLLKQRKELTDRLAISRKQLDDGNGVELDDMGLRELFDGLKDRARKHSVSENGT